MSMKRYIIKGTTSLTVEVEDAEGRYVLYADHLADREALLATLRQAVEMVEQARDACHSEYMDCPWCSGKLGHESDWHDEKCTLAPFLAACRGKLEEQA